MSLVLPIATGISRSIARGLTGGEGVSDIAPGVDNYLIDDTNTDAYLLQDA